MCINSYNSKRRKAQNHDQFWMIKHLNIITLMNEITTQINDKERKILVSKIQLEYQAPLGQIFGHVFAFRSKISTYQKNTFYHLKRTLEDDQFFKCTHQMQVHCLTFGIHLYAEDIRVFRDCQKPQQLCILWLKQRYFQYETAKH